MKNLRRLQFIEVILQWEGELTAKRVQDYFSISRTIAQQLITHYKKTYPNNITQYNGSAKHHQPSKQFTPQLTQGDLAEYLSFFHQESTVESLELNRNLPYLALLPIPNRHSEPRLIRSVIQACKQQKRLDIGYFSVSSGVTESRIISPHAIVFDGIRWHTRAWCERSQAFRDFVLSRFHDEPIFEDTPAQFTQQQDDEWNLEVSLVIQPDPRLNQSQRKAIELDYNMTDGQLSIPCRAALVKYLIQKLRLDSYSQRPEGQQIIIESNCWHQLEPYRFKG